MSFARVVSLESSRVSEMTPLQILDYFGLKHRFVEAILSFCRSPRVFGRMIERRVKNIVSKFDPKEKRK